MSFPGNVVEVMRTYLPNLLETSLGDAGNVVDNIEFVGRPVQETDPNPTVSCYPADWLPDGHEIGQFQPTLTRYHYVLQLLVKHTEEEEARELHSTLTTALRINLYRNPSLKDAILTLSSTALSQVERAKKYGISRVRFFNNDIRGEFIFLSNMDFWVDIESPELP